MSLNNYPIEWYISHAIYSLLLANSWTISEDKIFAAYVHCVDCRQRPTKDQDHILNLILNTRV